MPDPSPQQEQCVASALRWIKTPATSRKPTFRISGPAGSGKTFVIKHIIAALPEDIRVRTQYCAPTGKAALVMQSYGCYGATTVHKKIYTPNGNKTADKTTLSELKASFERRLNTIREQIKDENLVFNDPELKKLSRIIDKLESECQPIFQVNPESNLKDAKLLVISECSMVAEEMAKDLLAFKVPILLEGDPYQLPPVFGKSYFMYGKADFDLTEVHRQGKGSPILELARKARMGTDLRPGDYGDGCAVVDKISAELAMQADQIIVGRNLTRHKKNYGMRVARGFIPSEIATDDLHIPREGEKLVCLRNDNEAGLLNGSLWKCLSAHEYSDTKLMLSVVSEDSSTDRYTGLTHSELFKGESQKNIPQWQLMQKGIQQFDFGYALTCHKAQGSQWDFVIVYDEGDQFADFRKWRYTAFTRPRKRLIVVRTKKP